MPQLNFDAKTVYDLTDLTKNTLEPPVTVGMSNTQLEEILTHPLDLNLPISTMAVERGVKTVTKASTVTADPVLQDGYFFQVMAAQKKNSLKCRDKKVWGV